MAVTEHREGVQEPEPEHELAVMTVWEHLAELRNRLIVAIVAVAALAVVCWFFYNDAIQFMRSPYCSFVHHHPKKSLAGCSLYFTGPLEGVATRLKVSVYGGIVLAAPVILYQFWRFVTPALRKNEKQYVVPFVSSATVLFALGVTTAILVFPKALTWLIDVSGNGVVPLFTPTKYFTLYVAMCVIFGTIFMYPLVLVSLELTGVVPSSRWRKWRRQAVVAIAVVAAVITPSSDPFSFLAMAVPMYLFYEGSIVVGRVMKK
jgi:sec-independent protein translocase protein TatC